VSLFQSISIAALIVAAGACPAVALDPSREISQYGHSVWRTENGLPQNMIRAILQTKSGYIWLATEEGLARFDGITFTVFDEQNTPAIRSNNIQVIYEDRQANLWIGTDNGLVKWNGASFVPYTTNEGLSHNNVVCLHQDRNGNVWAGTTGGLNRINLQGIVTYGAKDGLPGDGIGSIYEDRAGNLWIGTLNGLARFDGKRFSAFTIQDGLPSNGIISFHEASNGDLWFGTSNGLALFRSGAFTSYTTRDGLSNNMIWAIEEDGLHDLWIGTDNGLIRIAEGKFSSYTTQNGLPDNTVTSIYRDRNGVLWLGTPGGLGRVKNGSASSYTARDGLAGNVVLSIYEDREDNLWVGTEGGGLNVLKETKFTTYTTRDGLADDMVWTICEGRDSTVWVGTQRGLSRFKNGKITNYTTKDGLPSNIVRAICEDADGNMWFGTPAGLAELKNGRFVLFTVQDGLSSNAVWSIHDDGRGSLWVGTLGGLTRIRDGKFTVYTARDGLSDDSVLSIQSDSHGALWLGTREGGLNRFADGRFSSFGVNEGLFDNSIRSIYEDSDGTIWAGTRRGGLNRYKDGRITAITSKAGLFDDGVYQILEDGSGNLWMSSAKGIFRASRAELNAFVDGQASSIECISYGTSDGMQTRECNGGQPAAWRAKDGSLWFSTTKGIARIDPEHLRLNEAPPPIAIERVVVDSRTVDTSITQLPAGSERLEFRYAGLSFVAPEKIRFKYRLEGYDKDWIDAGTSRVASYTSIPPGSYTFRVIASNNDGVWNEQGAALAFAIKPHFYQTKWFYAALAGGVALLAWGAYRLRLRQVKARFAMVLAERNRLAREIHDTLAQGFVGIGLQLDAAEKMLDRSPEQSKRHLELAENMVKHSLTEARRTIADLRSQVLDNGDLADALAGIARQLTSGTKVDARVASNGTPHKLDAAVENHLLRIGQEAMTNAIKHGNPTKIEVELSFQPRQVTLSVRDNGCGFDNQRALPSRDGHFGLVGMRERADRLKGTLTLNSEPGHGTDVVITVPLEADRRSSS